MTKLRMVADKIRSGLWFMPLLMVLSGIGLAALLLLLDARMGPPRPDTLASLLRQDAGGAREMLSMMAGSLMTLVGLTFSMTLIALTLASSQYTSRVLGNFMRNLGTQAALGAFVGIYAYCMVVHYAIRQNGEGEAFVPVTAIFTGFLLALAAVATLIYFLHHVASSIQVSGILDVAAREGRHAVDVLFPDEMGKEPKPEEGPAETFAAWHPAPALRSGFIQTVDADRLVMLACEKDVVIRMENGIGDFVIKGRPLLCSSPWPLEGARVQAALKLIYSIGHLRTTEQDPGFGIRQIVDVALRALSPGVNETTTAIMALDYLVTILSRLASRRIPSPYRYQDGRLRVVAQGPTFEGLLDEAFNEIRCSANGNASVLLRILRGLEEIGAFAGAPPRRKALLEHVARLEETGLRTLPAPYERSLLERRLAETRAALLAAPGKASGPY